MDIDKVVRSKLYHDDKPNFSRQTRQKQKVKPAQKYNPDFWDLHQPDCHFIFFYLTGNYRDQWSKKHRKSPKNPCFAERKA